MENEKINLMPPTDNFVFGRLFGHKGNEEITKRFLTLITKEEYDKIELETEKVTEKDLKNDKVGRLDILAITGNIQINVEMQVDKYEYMAERMLWYWSQLYFNSIEKRK